MEVLYKQLTQYKNRNDFYILYIMSSVLLITLMLIATGLQALSVASMHACACVSISLNDAASRAVGLKCRQKSAPCMRIADQNLIYV